MGRFTATVSKWTADSKEAVMETVRQSTLKTYEDMIRPRDGGGNMPVKSGYLRASARASYRVMPRILRSRQGKEGQFYSPSRQVQEAIEALPTGGKIHIGFQAAYAAKANYGGAKQKGSLFLEQAAQKWKSNVAVTEDEVGKRLGVK